MKNKKGKIKKPCLDNIMRHVGNKTQKMNIGLIIDKKKLKERNQYMIVLSSKFLN